MLRFKIASPESTPTFIGAWVMDDPSCCDEIIEFFNSDAAQKKAGELGDGLKPELKKSVDVSVKPKDLEQPQYAPFMTFLEHLHACYEDYKELWPFLGRHLQSIHIPTFVIKRYRKGEHFRAEHAERMSLTKAHRLFAWMAYLNDVETGGETVFTHYGIKVKPQKGLTLIWPGEWTHAHYGGEVISDSEKYILNGHMNFPP